MGIWKRIRIYAIGFGIGLIITSYFFGDRGGCNIFPSNAIKKDIKTSKFISSDYLECKLRCNDLNTDSIVDIINNGEVFISESERHVNPREYVLRKNGKRVVFAVDKNHLEPTYILDDFEIKCPECDSLSKLKNRFIKLPFKKKK